MTKYYYATLDDTGEGTIREDAEIVRFTSKAAMRKWLLAGYHNGGWDLESAVIEPGDFSDCWIKSSKGPRRDDTWYKPFGLANIIVRKPGEHPGSHGYWIKPRPPVYIVSRISPLESEDDDARPN